jgi:hypothetical protein
VAGAVAAERFKGIALAALAAAAIALGVSSVAIHRSSQSMEQGRVLVQRINGLLAEHSRLLVELARQPQQSESGDLLADYLANIRRDGAAMHVSTRRGLSRLAANQLSLLALADAYEPLARGIRYPDALRDLRAHVQAWNERWNALFEVFMAGGNLGEQQTPFPQSFADAMRAEGASPD